MQKSLSILECGVKMHDGNVLFDHSIVEEFASEALKKLDNAFEKIIAKIEPPVKYVNEKLPIDEIINALNDLIKTNTAKPKYINDLIDNGYIMPDGKTVLTGLDNIAEFLYTKIENLSANLLLQFRQKDGSEFTLRTAQAAISRCKPR
jgi:ABC-type transporter Mla subunit MlaD